MEILNETETIVKVYKTPEYMRRAIYKHQSTDAYKLAHKIDAKLKYAIRRQNPEYVLQCQKLSAEYRLKKKLEKQLSIEKNIKE
jgi:hypothetical protein